MPKATPEHATLARFAGRWHGEETLHPTPWQPELRQATGTFEFRMDLDGFFLIANYVERQDDTICYAGHGVYGYDPKIKRYTQHWFDSMGGIYDTPALGTFEGVTLCFEKAHDERKARYTYAFEGDALLTFRIDLATDAAAWTPMMEGRYTKG